jgi:hypothetical protein
MPLKRYKCSCGTTRGIFYNPNQPYPENPLCLACGKEMIRDPSMASSQVKEVVDNGVMARRVEVTKKE